MSYSTTGWVHIENYIPKEDIPVIREICIKARKVHSEQNPDDFKGVQCAAKIYPELWRYYTSEYMFNLAKSLLNTDPIFIFNDQIVVKLPNDKFAFGPHYDNKFRDPDGIETVNCCLILDDFTEHNGSLSIKNKDNKKWINIFPKAGDIVAIDGDTVHASSENLTNEPRCLYACVYASQKIKFNKFYTDEFIIYDK